MDKIKSFRELKIWSLGKDIVLEIYERTKIFPKEELFSLVSQMRRSAISIPSNIAEGFSRYHNKEYRQFLFHALGSCSELETQLEICYDLKYIENQFKTRLIEKIQFESKMIRNLIKKLNLVD
ncbi:MAG TPA: four helix bundle protein [Candidatus Omnitrophota bacterium]|nr:four helix bundle protein [Candidatus Omnitrophota bacterium]